MLSIKKKFPIQCQKKKHKKKLTFQKAHDLSLPNKPCNYTVNIPPTQSKTIAK